MASKVKQSRIFSKCRVEIIENPIDDVFFEEQSRDSIRTKLNLSHDAIVGAFVAAQLDSPQKNTAELVEAFFKATQAISEDSFLILIGEGGQSFARMHPNVILGGPGDSEHVARLLAASDFIVSASQVESAGMFVREAGALGIPSLITSNGGSDEMIKNGESGYVFSNSSELTLGISRLCSNRSSFTKLGEKARKIAQENSQSDSVARRYLSIYE
jgi:glycosyltransferase involved in cell wall biosynthesis